MRKLNSRPGRNKIEAERQVENVQQSIAEMVLQENDKFDERYLCADCVSEKQQIKKNLQNMNDDEIKRN